MISLAVCADARTDRSLRTRLIGIRNALPGRSEAAEGLVHSLDICNSSPAKGASGWADCHGYAAFRVRRVDIYASWTDGGAFSGGGP